MLKIKEELIRRMYPSGHVNGCFGSGMKWSALPCPESPSRKKSSHSQKRELLKSPLDIQKKSYSCLKRPLPPFKAHRSGRRFAPHCLLAKYTSIHTAKTAIPYYCADTELDCTKDAV
jgi:hypothetical protein